MEINRLLSYNELSQIEIDELKSLIHDNDKWFTEYNAEYDVIEGYLVEVVQEAIKLIQLDDSMISDGSTFICSYNPLYETIEDIFNEDKDGEFFNEVVDEIVEAFNDLTNHVLYKRNLYTKQICFSFDGYSEGLILETLESIEEKEELT